MKILELKRVGLVALGGVIGSLSRWGFSILIPNHSFAWGTLFVNYLGSVVLTVLVVMRNIIQALNGGGVLQLVPDFVADSRRIQPLHSNSINIWMRKIPTHSWSTRWLR